MTILPRSPHIRSLIALTVIFLFALYHIRGALHNVYVILRMPLAWRHGESSFLISSSEPDSFDLSFASYNSTQDSFAPEIPDLVPPILHHIVLGSAPPNAEWVDARDACLAFHPGWQARLWTDENASAFVHENFPELWGMWQGYKYPIQRIDALRYLVLYHYGGVVLDMDLKCTRSLGPLRRFGFVAPAAHPAGFSIGFMMASAQHSFLGELVANLPVFNQWWLGLPYPTVMFSTGCHYASAIHTLQRNRPELKVLSGPASNPKLHSLNGDVVTPLFHHLGTSSWHSFDASLIVLLGRSAALLKLLVFAIVLVIVLAVFNTRRGRSSYAKSMVGGVHTEYPAKLERDSSFYERVLQGYGRTRRKIVDDIVGDRMA